MHIQAAINGGCSKAEHENIPVTMDEVVQEAIAVARAGASSIHLHPRNHAGREALDRDMISPTLALIRKAVQIPVGISTERGSYLTPNKGWR